MDTMLEQLRKTAEAHAAVYEAYKAEVTAQELPEVWYLHRGGDCGTYYAAGCEENTQHWLAGDEAAEGFSRTQIAFWVDNDYYSECTAAEYNNAYALHHGADFTGRLQDIDVPVCELNQATRDEMDGHRWDEFETIVGGVWTDCVSFGEEDGAFCDEASAGCIYRLRAPKTRPMTRKEVLAWAASADAFGWVVMNAGGCALTPQSLVWSAPIEAYQRAPIVTLNDDGTGGEWEAFEVTV